MAVTLAGVSLPGPSEVLGTARSIAGWGARTGTVVAGLPERAERLLDGLEGLLGRVDELAGRADELVARVAAVAEAAERTVAVATAVTSDAAAVVSRATMVTDDAAAVVTGAERITGAAGSVVEQAAGASRDATALLRTVEPLANQAAPLAGRFIRELSEQEVVAAVQLVDQLPRLAEHMETDVMPILATLDRVGPDISELLNVVKDLRQAIAGIPGLAYLRRRGAPPVVP